MKYRDALLPIFSRLQTKTREGWKMCEKAAKQGFELMRERTDVRFHNFGKEMLSVICFRLRYNDSAIHNLALTKTKKKNSIYIFDVTDTVLDSECCFSVQVLVRFFRGKPIFIYGYVPVIIL